MTAFRGPWQPGSCLSADSVAPGRCRVSSEPRESAAPAGQAARLTTHSSLYQPIRDAKFTPDGWACLLNARQLERWAIRTAIETPRKSRHYAGLHSPAFCFRVLLSRHAKALADSSPPCELGSQSAIARVSMRRESAVRLHFQADSLLPLNLTPLPPLICPFADRAIARLLHVLGPNPIPCQRSDPGRPELQRLMARR